MHFLALPYDVRHMIYQHLYPPESQLYIQVVSKNLLFLPRERTIPTALLRTSRAINREASEYLYNNYLFNIIGSKMDCLERHVVFLQTMRKYAREEVHVDMFGNGEHSQTMCISVQAGEAKMALLKSRERGEPKTLRQIMDELGVVDTAFLDRPILFGHTRRRNRFKGLIYAALCAIIAVVIKFAIDGVRAILVR
jgi:hypothetical protein